MIKYAVKYIKNTFVPLKCPDNVNLDDGVLILARTEKGEEALKAFLVNKDVAKHFEASNKTPAPFEFIRIMTQEDMMVLEELKKEEVTSFFKCKDLVKKHNLNMNLVQCRITFDKRKISFYYTAPERVDFRELLKDLTQVFKRMRIDLRHIGVRDKISGTCGRLLCCLTYEYSNYIEAAKGMPPVGSTVMTPSGLGKVCFIQFLNNSVAVKFEDGKIKEYCKNDIEMVDADVNVDIEISRINNYSTDEKVDAKQLKQLEDDRNSSTGNV